LVSSADAQEQRPLHEALSIQYQGQCIDHASLSSAVAQWLGGDLIGADLAVSVEGGDEPVPHAHFELRRMDESIVVRRFSNLKNGCEDLQKALPFAIAIAIDARVVQSRDASLPAPTARPRVDVRQAAQPEVVPAPSLEPKAEPPPAVEASEVASVRASIGPAASISSIDRSRHAFQFILQTQWLRAVAPQDAWAAQVGFGWRVVRWFEAELGALASLPDTAALGSGQAKFVVAGAIAQACGRHDFAVTLRACVGGATGVVRAEGMGYAQDLRATGSWLSGVGGVDIAWPPRARLAVRLSAQVLPAVRRPALFVTDSNGVEVSGLQAPKLGTTLALGLSLSL